MDLTTTDVLVVDDESGLGEIVTAILSERDLSCLIANSPQVALHWLRAGKAGAIVCDLYASADDETSLVEAVRRVSAIPILVAGYALDPYLADVRIFADVGVLQRPIDPISMMRNLRARCSTTWDLRASLHRESAMPRMCDRLR